MKARKRRTLPTRKKARQQPKSYTTVYKEPVDCAMCNDALPTLHPTTEWDRAAWAERRQWHNPVRGDLYAMAWLE